MNSLILTVALTSLLDSTSTAQPLDHSEWRNATLAIIKEALIDAGDVHHIATVLSRLEREAAMSSLLSPPPTHLNITAPPLPTAY
ncbi:hypothetical protein ACTXK7_07160 [Vreelandella alkaliphila]|uniref:hypothetical protein n=1 Tax=Vreelandella alkaliphila TaxID=272774 RepID=UPI003FD75751